MRPLADEFSGFRCLGYQQRGLEPSLLDGPKAVERHVCDAVAVLDGLGIARAVVAGHSWGGVLGLHLAIAEPERVRGLVVIDGSGGVGAESWDERHAALGRGLSEPAQRRLEELETLSTRRPLTETEAREIPELLWPSYFAAPELAPPMPLLRFDEQGYTEAVASVDGHFARGTLDRQLPELETPVLFIHGRADPLPIAAMQATADVMPNATFVSVEECGHFPWLEKPATIATAVTQWARDRLDGI